MKIFNGTYSWDGKKHGDREPIAWFPGTYNLRIFNLSAGNRGVFYLKPHLCIFSETGQGHSISANPEKFAKHVCTDFSLDVERVLWVEELHNEAASYEVTVFTKSGKLGESLLYHVDKRPPSAAELKLIKKELAGVRH